MLLRKAVRHSLALKIAAVLSLLAGACAACTTPPRAKVITRAEIVERDNAMGTELAAQFEAQVKLKNDREVSVFLRKLAQKLSEASAELRSSNVGVLVIRDKLPVWKSFGVPGNRVYLSVGLIRALEFENEIAALIAYELAHIQKRHLMERIQANAGEPSDHAEYPNLTGLGATEKAVKPIDFFGTSGVFVFSEEAELEAVDAAIDLLYRSGYDPRGMLGIWGAYTTNSRQSPYETTTLQKLVERTRRTISGYAPLLNPIVRSTGFIAIQKRIKKL